MFHPQYVPYPIGPVATRNFIKSNHVELIRFKHPSNLLGCRVATILHIISGHTDSDCLIIQWIGHTDCRSTDGCN